MANRRVGEGFVAVSAEARKKFWLDRARTAAIAKHTNAFKINEDVVIPLERMGEYTDGIDQINIGKDFSCFSTKAFAKASSSKVIIVLFSEANNSL